MRPLLHVCVLAVATLVLGDGAAIKAAALGSGTDAQAAALGELTRHWLQHHATPRQAQQHLDMVRAALPGTELRSDPHGHSSVPEIAHRRSQQSRRCTFDSLSSRSAELNSECCDEPTEDCSSGEPATCNAGCAAVLLPFFEDCRDTLEASQGYLPQFLHCALVEFDAQASCEETLRRLTLARACLLLFEQGLCTR